MGNWFSRNTDPQQSSDDAPPPNPLDVMDAAVTRMSAQWEKTAFAIRDYKEVMTAIDYDSYREVVQDYLTSSLELRDFFTEVENFLDSARRSHSYIERAIQSQHGVGREKIIFDNIIMASNDSVDLCDELYGMAKSLTEKMNDLFNKYCNMTKIKLSAMPKIKLSAWRKFVNYLSGAVRFFSCLSIGLTILIIFFKPEDTQSKVVKMMKLFNDALKSTHEWNNSNRKDIEKHSAPKNDVLEQMINYAQHNYQVMGDLTILIKELKNSAVSIRNWSQDDAHGILSEGRGIENIRLQLDKFLGKIKDLEEKTRGCSAKISKAREALTGEKLP